MKAKSTIKLLLVLFIIAAMVYLSVSGIKVGNYEMKPITSGVKLGLDIAGGSYIEYQATENVASNNTTATAVPATTAATTATAVPVADTSTTGANKTDLSQDDIDTTIAILRQRATTQGYTEANVIYSNNGRFRVELPNVGDPNEASRILGKVARLTFEDPDNNVIVDGKDVKNAQAVFKSTESNGKAEHHVELQFTDEGRAKFSEATGRLVGKNITIKLDGQVYQTATVKTKIDTETAIITLGNTKDADKQAKELSGLIRSGQLPFGLKEVGASSISATLGQSAFKSSLNAGLVVIILIALYMILFYRLPGLVAAIALIFYSVLTVLSMGLFGINLNLPGIAGLILSIGMAVDANVVIFERIIDEIKNGKTLRASVDAGFHRALVAVVDANVTTLISAAVLYWLGSGTVKGFAITLFLGVVISMFTAISLTKFLMVQLLNLDIKNRRLYGIGLK